MRTTMLIAAVIALTAGAFVSTTNAQKNVIKSQELGQRVDPIRVAPVMGWENGKPIVGKWRAFTKEEGIGGTPFPSAVIFDSFEGDTHFGNADVCDGDPASNFPANGPLSGGVSPACDFGNPIGNDGSCGAGDTSRWWFGLDLVSDPPVQPAWASYIGAIGSFADNAPNVATAVSCSWSMSFGLDDVPPNNPPCNNYTSTVILITFYDNTVASKIDPKNVQDVTATDLADGFVDGIILDFGEQATSLAGYSFASIDLTDDIAMDPDLALGVVEGVEVGLPEDGALEISFWTDTDGLGTLAPGTYAQAMLWAPKDPALQGSWNTAMLYLDGFWDDVLGTHVCAAYDGQYLNSVFDDTLDDALLANDPTWPGECPSILMPSIGLYGEPTNAVAATSFDRLRGAFVSGDVSDVQESDDSYLKYDAGITLNPDEPPVWLQFDATLPTDSPTSLSVTLEASVSTPNLSQTICAFNWVSGQYEEIDVQAASFPADSVVTVDLTANIANYVQSGTGAVKIQAKWKYTDGLILGFPWRVCVDQVVWTE